MIITRTPYRISFFGGGTDYPAWYRQYGGAVLATTIDKYCHITCRHLPPFFDHKHRVVYSRIETVNDIGQIQHPAVRNILQWARVSDGLEIHHDGDLPARSGIGSSSSFTVGLLNALAALDGRMISKQRLAENAIHIEQNVIGEHVGSQDQVSAAFGGFNRIDFHPSDAFSVSPLVLPKMRKAALNSHLMLCFTGLSRVASKVAKSKIENLSRREQELNRIREMVEEAVDILTSERRPLEDFGELLHEGWRMKRQLASCVTTPEVDEIYDVARDAGAIGGKLLGAGGGGFMLLFARPEQQPRIRERLSNLIHVPFRFEDSGSRIIVYSEGSDTA